MIAALNGGVFGGGVDLALACDFRIGVEGMKMFVPPDKLGIHYEPEALQARATALAKSVTALAPMAVQGMKQTILETSQNRLDTAAAKARVRACFASANHAEGLQATREKRPPKFTGQ